MSIKVAVITLAIVLLVANAHAGVKPGDGLLILNVGYAMATSKSTGDAIDGAFFGLDYQKLDWNKPVSGGFSIAYGEIHESISGADSTEADITVSTVPVYLGGKYWLGSGDGRLQGYLGLAFGTYFSQLKTSVTSTVGIQDETYSGSFTSETALGFGLGVPVGVALSLGESLLLTANYTLNWLWENEFLDNDILNSFSLGVAFRFGD